MNISSRHSNSNFAYSLTSIALPILRRWFLFGMSYYVTSNLHLKQWSMDSNMVSKTWVRMSTTNFTPIKNSKFDFECRYIWSNTDDKNVRFLTLHSPFCLFLKITFHSEYFGVYFSWWNCQMCIKMINSNSKKTKSSFSISNVLLTHNPFLYP